jgi:hypothetical protein
VTNFGSLSLHAIARVFTLILIVGALPAVAAAQTTTGTITGRVTDAQGAALPGVSVHAGNADTGFARDAVSDEAGSYRLPALPVGQYAVVADLNGFRRYERTLIVNVATTVNNDIVLALAGVTELVTVTSTTPLVSTRHSSVGEVVDLTRIQSLPLNGRQFANLAATVPGIGLTFHSDTSKGAQYAPQISGGNGRNINYLVDGGDNNDDTVGGLLQLFPLEAVQEFNVLTQRFDAEYGRANGAVLNVITKSGTNSLRGSWFSLLRDDGMNARTLTEKSSNVPKQAYRRYQYGGSVGGPIVRDKAHYFAAFERTQQDVKQAVNTLGIYPLQDGVFDVPFRENLFTGKLTFAPAPAHYVALRYGRDTNTQTIGASPRTTRSAWATGTSTFDSINVNHNWITGRSTLNEFIFQFSSYTNDVPEPAVAGPVLQFANGVMAGVSPTAPQRTEQRKWQYRDDFSWTHSGGGSHEFRTGVNWIHEPRLFAFTGQGLDGIFVMGGNDPNGAVIRVLEIGGQTSSNIPIDLYGAYVQDDWRVTSRLTLNAGVRWDYAKGMPLDQEQSANFRAMQAAGRAGRFAGTMLDDFGQEVRGDRNNVQPRVGAVYDLFGNGRDVLRGGWGIYTDFGYTNSNALTAALDAGGGGGIVYSAQVNSGIRKEDGTLFRITDPINTIEYLNTVNRATPTSGEVVSPLLEQPYSYQTNAGWSHELSPSTALSVDYVRVQGRDLNMRVRPNTLVDGRPYIGDVGIQPNDTTFRVALSRGRSEYHALITAVRRRMSRRVDLNASYTLATATSDVGSAYDEIAQNLIQDVTQPFADLQNGPSTRTDARHRVTMSAIVQLPWQLQVAPIVFYRSALPVHSIEGLDLNHDGNRNDKTTLAYRYTGLTGTTATFEEAGPCKTVNCSRRAPFSQVNVRISRVFGLPGSARIEAIAEVFNLFNAVNPFIPLTTSRLTPGGAVNTTFMQPTAYAGDVGQPEQRVGQIGFRVTF